VVPPAGIEPATPGLGIQKEGFYKGLKIPEIPFAVGPFNRGRNTCSNFVF
jgi:hypothetical protein